MKNYVPYKGWMLSTNSDSYKLYLLKKFQELDEHLKQQHQAAFKRGETLGKP